MRQILKPEQHSKDVSLSAVSVTYPGAGRPAVENISFTLRPGEVLLIIGPSGCGKSTVAHTLNGLVPQSLPAQVMGHISVAGSSPAQNTVAQMSRHVGIVFQDPDSQILMETVFDEVAFGPENLCMPPREVAERSETAIRDVGLWAERLTDPLELSGGERQRLAIACALVMGVDTLVLDEPTANLDTCAAHRIYEALDRTRRHTRMSLVLVEHNIDAALPIIDRVLVLDHHGRAVMQGPPDEVFGGHGAALADLGVRLPAPTRIALALTEESAPTIGLPVTEDDFDSWQAQRRASLPTLPRRRSSAAHHLRPGPPAVELDRVTISLGTREVIKNASLVIPAGSWVAILGKNRAGKTTLAQLIAGIQRPQNGSVSVEGRELRGRRRLRQNYRIGYVFQNPEHQFLTETVGQELLVAARRALGKEGVHATRLANETLDRFGLGDVRNLDPFLLSGGQKRRLSVATQIIDPAKNILVLDEPTFGQDQKYTDEIARLLSDLNREGVTIIMTTHDLDLVAEHASHVALVNDTAKLTLATSQTVLDDADLLHEYGLEQPISRRLLTKAGLPQDLLTSRST